ncbi:MAG: hypothetical protein EOO38_29455, partial [Cytophagaceae bacterium]
MLTLAPHDFPWDGDGLAQHTLTYAYKHGEDWDVGVGGTTRSDGSRAVCCQKHDWPLLYITGTAGFHQNFVVLSEIIETVNADAFGLRMIFADAIAKEKWGRAFFLTEQLQLRQKGEQARFFLLLSPHGWGFWRDLLNEPTHYRNNGEQSGFIWSQSNEHNWLLGATALQAVEHIVHQFKTPHSDSAFALNFASLPPRERRKLLWPCKRGDTDQMEGVLRQALLAQDEFWE